MERTWAPSHEDVIERVYLEVYTVLTLDREDDRLRTGVQGINAASPWLVKPEEEFGFAFKYPATTMGKCSNNTPHLPRVGYLIKTSGGGFIFKSYPKKNGAVPDPRALLNGQNGNRSHHLKQQIPGDYRIDDFLAKSLITLPLSRFGIGRSTTVQLSHKRSSSEAIPQLQPLWRAWKRNSGPSLLGFGVASRRCCYCIP